MAWGPDGFPLYGPYGDNGEVPTDLDACGGHSSDSGANGGYHYHFQGTTKSGPTEDMTSIEGYPYVMKCVKGCVADSQPGKSLYDSVSYNDCVTSSTTAPAGAYINNFTLASVDYEYPGYESGDEIKAMIFKIALGVVGLIFCCCIFRYCRTRYNTTIENETKKGGKEERLPQRLPQYHNEIELRSHYSHSKATL